MSNDLPVMFGEGELTLDSLKSAITNTLHNAPTVEKRGDTNFAKLAGDDWVIGKDGEGVENDDEFIVVLEASTHGYVAWHGGRPEFKKMIPIRENLATIKLPSPDTIKAKHGIEDARGIVMMGTGAWQGEKVAFETNSSGGRETIEDMLRLVNQRMAAGDPALYPLVRLSSTSYNHAEHGRIVKPVITVVGWFTRDQAIAASRAPDGVPAPQSEPEPELAAPPAEEKPSRRRR